MMMSKQRKSKPGDTVVLIKIPPGLLEGLPTEDREAIAEAVGKPIRLNEYDEKGRAELEFRDRNGVVHFIFVKQDFIATHEQAES
ncbi:MAG: hypothetical protein WAN76_17235 [Candidatus Sulfotelmatobacter sp.]